MVEEIKRLCKENGTSVKALERELSCGNGTIRRWDDSPPAFDKVVKVAAHLGVPVSRLTGEDPENKNPALIDENGMDETTIELLKIAHEIDAADRQMLLDMARSIKKRRES